MNTHTPSRTAFADYPGSTTIFPRVWPEPTPANACGASASENERTSGLWISPRSSIVASPSRAAVVTLPWMFVAPIPRWPRVSASAASRPDLLREAGQALFVAVHVGDALDPVRVAGSDRLHDVIRCVIDDVHCPEPPGVVGVLALADGHHAGAPPGGQLHEVAPHPARRPDRHHDVTLRG